MFKNIIKVLGGDPNKRDVERYTEIVDHINKDLMPVFEKLSDDELKAKSNELKEKVQSALADLAGEERKAATQAALALRKELSALFTRLGCTHVQIGKSYPYLKTREPATLALLNALKTAVDPRHLMNRGSLGFGPRD